MTNPLLITVMSKTVSLTWSVFAIIKKSASEAFGRTKLNKIRILEIYLKFTSENNLDFEVNFLVCLKKCIENLPQNCDNFLQ